ncbi:MAG: radical SAM protein [Candidatus Omnitrophota bacterium]
MSKAFRFIYGPVYSWRLGRSLGVDPLSQADKVCNMDCIYCQLGREPNLTSIRKVYVSVDEIMEEIKQIPSDQIDYVTFSGNGEPTLAANLGDMIRVIKSSYNKKVAVITNSVLIYLEDVQQDLARADFVLAKLDAGNQKDFVAINGNVDISFEKVLEGIKAFRKKYQGKLALQVMITPENFDKLESIAQVAQELQADEVQLNTPLRSCPVKPIDVEQMQKAKEFFINLPVTTVFDTHPKENIQPFDEKATVNRHGKSRKLVS